MSILTDIPNSSKVGFQVVVKNTFINVVPEECNDSTSPSAQSCLARLMESSLPRIFDKFAEESNVGDSSTTFGDDSSSRSEPEEGNHGESDLPPAQFYDHSSYIETPVASPYMATASACLSGFPAAFESRFMLPLDHNDDLIYGNTSVNQAHVELHIASYLPAPFLHIAPTVIEKELISLPPHIPSQIGIVEAEIKSMFAESRTAPGISAAFTASIGSQKHSTLTNDGYPVCQPCAWFHREDGCQNGMLCQYCHMCPPGELKNRKKQKIACRRYQKTNKIACPRYQKTNTTACPRYQDT